MSILLGFVWTVFIALKVKPFHSTTYSVVLWTIGMLGMAYGLQKLEDASRRIR